MAGEGRGGMIGEADNSAGRGGGDVERGGAGPSAGLDDANEERSFRNPEVGSLSPPAAGEVDDYADEGEPSGGMQQGADRTRFPEKDAAQPQGPKTTRINRERAQSGSPDQGTH